MELRRILMGLYLLAFPAMMWGQTPVVPGTTDEEHSGHRKETPVSKAVSPLPCSLCPSSASTECLLTRYRTITK